MYAFGRCQDRIDTGDFATPCRFGERLFFPPTQPRKSLAGQPRFFFYLFHELHPGCWVVDNFGSVSRNYLRPNRSDHPTTDQETSRCRNVSEGDLFIFTPLTFILIIQLLESSACKVTIMSIQIISSCTSPWLVAFHDMQLRFVDQISFPDSV